MMAKSLFSSRLMFLILQIHLSWCSFDSSFTITSDMTNESEISGGSFSRSNYSWWLRDHRIRLVNYLVKVNDTVTIRCPIDPVPRDLHWSSLKMESQVPASKPSHLVGLSYSHYFEKFAKTHNRSWTEAFDLDRRNRWLKIRNVQFNFTDVYRVYVDVSSADYKDAQDFDVAINLLVYANHECGFQSRPITPRKGDAVVLHCSAVVNRGLWRPSFIFRNSYDGSTIERTATKICGYQPNVGFKTCASARIVIRADAPVLAYSCQLHFSEEHRLIPGIPAFGRSKWTTRFQRKSVCFLPTLYTDVMPSDVSFLCNGVSCGETVRVGQSVVCHAHGHPQPDFRLEVFRTPPPPPSTPSKGLKEMINAVEALENFLDEGGAARLSDQGHARDILQFIIRTINPLISGSESNSDFHIYGDEPLEGKENLTKLVRHFQVTMSKCGLNDDSGLNESFWQLEELAASGRLNMSTILDFFDNKVGRQLSKQLLLKNSTEKQRRLTEELFDPIVNKINRKLADARKLLAENTSDNSTLKTNAEFGDDEETEMRIQVIDAIADFWELVDKGGDENDIRKAYENIMLYFFFSGFHLNNTKSENADLNTSRPSGLNSSSSVLAFNESADADFSNETEEIKTAKSPANTTDKELEILEQMTRSVDSTEHGNGTNAPATNRIRLNVTEAAEFNTESEIESKYFTTDESSDEEILSSTESIMATASPPEKQQPNGGGMKDVEEYVTTESDVGHVEVTCNVSNRLGWGFNSIGIDVLPSDSGETSAGGVAERLTALNQRMAGDSSIRRSSENDRDVVNRSLSRRSSHNSRKVPHYKAQETVSVALKGQSVCLLLHLGLLFLGFCFTEIEF